MMHRAAGADPHDRRLSELVGELSIRSETFRTDGRRTMCASATPAPAMVHPVVGELTLNF